MRITQFTMYNNFLINQQRTLNELNKTTTELSTGKKIQNMYDSPTVFVNDLKFQEKINTFTQIKNSANFAKIFANETDTTLNDIVTTLNSFKTKLLNAANDTNNKTSREAIAKELEGELNHLKDLANTSIGGKYIFSGSMFNTKPINNELKYQGNGETVKAFLGAGVEREYNIDGKSLFLGRDNDYKKHLSLNIPQFDKMKANPEYVVRGSDGKLYIDKHLKDHNKIPDSNDVPKNEPVTPDSEIRMLTGVEDIYDSNTDTYSDGTSYFYIKGKTSNGITINTKISLKNSEKVSALLDKIGELYGNTLTAKKVNVSINDMGEIQIKDVESGKLITDFYIVASDKNENSLEDVIKNGDYIVEFQKSNFNSVRNLDTIKANNGYFDNRIYTFGSIFRLMDNSRDALPSDKIQDVIGKKALNGYGNFILIDHLTLSGTDTDGNNVNVTLSVGPNTTMQDLIDKIKSDFGDVNVKLENGELKIIDNSLSDKTDTSKLSISIDAEDINGNKLLAFKSKDSINFDRLFMDKKGNLIQSNVTQIIKDYKTYIKDGKTYTIKNPDSQKIATDNINLTDVMGTDSMPQTLKIRFKDKDGNFNVAKIVLQDEEDSDGHLCYFKINGNKYDIYDSKGNKTPAHDVIKTISQIDETTCKICQKEEKTKGLTFRQLGDVIAMIVSNNIPATNSEKDYKNALENAKKEVKTGMDNGHFYLKDLNNNPSKIDIAIYNKNNNHISFEENNAVTIDSAKVDFFRILEKSIEAVKSGNNFPNGNSDNPRNFGIQGAIESIDHLNDHVRKMHAKIGAVSNEFEMSIERVETLTIHTKTLQSENIDTDIGEATMRLNSLKTSYQALLASIAKVNDLTLLNYLR
ncbi:flagellar hook-associated protein 3 FlgL [Lebetimonas natsushimae]|uniref:Flagellin n=1 Tax=Lebetimonas natsushimae TaxID=1936991 RepID=A0A292YFF0_9BACT|nr:flagellar hook-associated protein FlgL [Lebetimonas natsushimae]GAX87891.1 flagellar hook-associated protein 3 FlgL [Lebetimonas natsushimae]